MAHAAGEPRSVRAAPPIEWIVRVPGSKSLTNRALVLAAMAAGETTLEMALRSDDTDALSRSLAALGVAVEQIDSVPCGPGAPGGRHPAFCVLGCGGAFAAGPDVRVDLGDKGVWYRVQAGPLDEKQAQHICSALKSRKADCVTVPPR